MNINLKDSYLIKKELIGRALNKIDKIKTQYGIMDIEIYPDYGIVHESTKIEFYSKGSTYIIFVEVSQEVYE